MSYNFENMATCHGPTGLKFGVSATSLAKVDLLAISQDKALARSQTPYNADLVLLSAAFSSGEAFGKSFGVRKAKAKPDAPFGCRNTLSASKSRKVNCIGRVLRHGELHGGKRMSEKK
jgi:hypothetical protein